MKGLSDTEIALVWNPVTDRTSYSIRSAAHPSFSGIDLNLVWLRVRRRSPRPRRSLSQRDSTGDWISSSAPRKAGLGRPGTGVPITGIPGYPPTPTFDPAGENRRAGRGGGRLDHVRLDCSKLKGIETSHLAASGLRAGREARVVVRRATSSPAARTSTRGPSIASPGKTGA
jgi:hypothetical protein